MLEIIQKSWKFLGTAGEPVEYEDVDVPSDAEQVRIFEDRPNSTVYLFAVSRIVTNYKGEESYKRTKEKNIKDK